MTTGTVRVGVSQLKIGMYVAALDRPWLGTPFLFQGFRVDTVEQIQTLRDYCESVTVDIEKSAMGGAALGGSAAAAPPAPPPRVYEMSASFEQEIKVANEIRAVTHSCVEDLFEDVARGRLIDLPKIKRVVSETVDGILRNPDAHVCLTQLKTRDDYTAQHSINVCVLALAFARHLGMSPSDMRALGVGSLLHDIGKLRTPLDILNKPGKLTPKEFDIIKAHPVDGRRILERRYGLPIRVAETAYSHHERIGGGGYPRGLKGQEIPLWGKMVAIVDVYDAITSDRSYHQGISPTEALTKMYGWRLTDFDPDLLEQFIQCLGIYPVGTLVELASGEVGFVMSVNPESRLRPKVNLILDAQKNPLYPQRVVNLADAPTDPDATRPSIGRVLQPGTYGIDVREHLTPIQQAKAKHTLADRRPLKAVA
jgi:putative nucleotidyltransferase with HDIG domain